MCLASAAAERADAADKGAADQVHAGLPGRYDIMILIIVIILLLLLLVIIIIMILIIIVIILIMIRLI